ncbi:hypothetical protein [Desulfovibrio inopinatus]|nr:hypothetical protein [Desulfovibrio inopinatus]
MVGIHGIGKAHHGENTLAAGAGIDGQAFVGIDDDGIGIIV